MGLSQRVRVLHVAEAYSSGIMVVVDAIAQALAAAGSEVTIAYGRRPETPASPLLEAGVHRVALPWTARTPTSQARAAVALRRLARQRPPDIVHLHSSFAGVVGSAALGGVAPTVYTPHGYAFARSDVGPLAQGALRLAERWVARRVTVVGACSHGEARLAREAAHAPRVTAIPNGIPELDHPVRRREGPPERHRVVVTGRIAAQRLPLESASILASVRDVADVLWIGGGDRDPVHEQVLGSRGIPSTGWLSREEALRALRGASIALHWSAWEGLPLSILEALAEDVVVIASDIPPNREVLGPDQVCGSPAQATRVLRELITDPERYRKALRHQREQRAFYSAARATGQWLELYEQILSGRWVAS